MIPPFVICVSSLRKGVGKTVLGVAMAKSLVSKGFRVGALKHCHEEPSSMNKDSEKYFRAGCSVSIAIHESMIIQLARVSANLRDLAYLTRCPIVVAEGFKKERCDYRVVVIDNCNELAEVEKRFPDAKIVASKDRSCVDGRRILSFDDVQHLVDRVVEEARKYGKRFVAGLNCGACGYSTCEEAIDAWLRGAGVSCIAMCRAKLVVDGVTVPMNRFVCSMLESLVRAFVSNLRGVDSRAKNILIEIVGDRH